MSEFRAIPRELLERHIAEKNQPNRGSANTDRTTPEPKQKQNRQLDKSRQQMPGGPPTGSMVDHNKWALDQVKASHARRQSQQNPAREALEKHIEKTGTPPDRSASDFVKKTPRELQQNLTPKPDIER